MFLVWVGSCRISYELIIDKVEWVIVILQDDSMTLQLAERYARDTQKLVTAFYLRP
jgi:hypothetical protein